MKKTVYMASVVVFLTMFFIFFTFDSVNQVNIKCLSGICDRVSQILAMIFGFVTAGIFSIVAGGSLSIMLRESGAADNLLLAEIKDLKIARLENEHERLSVSMRVAQQQYDEKKINSDTLDRLVRKYRIEIAGVEKQIEQEKRKYKNRE
jgi:cell shape-determining protein MreC